jgi:hypothetical protein
MSSQSQAAEARADRVWLAAIVACGALGVALRVFELGAQVLGDDEIFELAAVLVPDAPIGWAYASAPQLALHRLTAATVGLSELSFRLPSLLPGIALLVVFPWLVWRRFGREAAGIVAGLLAISPLLVFYSRFTRPYMLPILLVCVGVLAYGRWLDRGDVRAAVVHVACGGVAAWFHWLAAPAALSAPFVGALLVRPRRRALPSLGIGLVAMASLALLLGDSLPSIWGIASEKARSGWIHLGTLDGAARLLAGVGHGGLAAAFWIGAVVGVGCGLRQRRDLTLLMLASVGAQTFAVTIAAPFMVDRPPVFSRYLTFALPFLLLFLALAIAELRRVRLFHRSWPAPAAGGLLLGIALYLGGPFPTAYYVPNNFTNHSDFQFAWAEERTDGAQLSRRFRLTDFYATTLPDFYQRLRDEPGDFEIVEAPSSYNWLLTPYHAYQRWHRKPVRLGVIQARVSNSEPIVLPLDDRRLRLDRYVDLRDPGRLRDSGVRYVVLHKDLGAETGGLLATHEMSAVIELHRRTFGAPFFEDPQIVVFSTRPTP